VITSALDVLHKVDLVVADLSLERPSCYFELGMAQTVGVPCFLIAEQGTRIHQHSGEVIFYASLEDYRRLISLAISSLVCSIEQSFWHCFHEDIARPEERSVSLALPGQPFDL
jgi:hypothetical protein